MSDSFKKLFHWLGSALAVGGVVFVGYRFREYNFQLDESLGFGLWLLILTLMLVYGIANVLLALAWRDILQYFGASVNTLWAIRVYGYSQMAKYVPGNIMHMASRQGMGMASGVNGWQLAKSSFWELGLISIACLVFAMLVLPVLWPAFLKVVLYSSFFLTAIIIALIVKWISGSALARAYLYYVAFLFISGSIYALVILSLSNDFNDEPGGAYLLLCGAFVISWFAGMVTPGAPAGVGVREMVLMAILGAYIQEVDLLLSVLLSRIITIGGDTAFFLASFAIPTTEASVRDG